MLPMVMSSSPRRSALWLVLGALLVAGGCGGSGPIALDNFYRLAPPAPVSAHPLPLLNGNLYIELPRAAGVHRSRALLYSQDPQQLRLNQYHSHHWEEAPAKLLRRRLATVLRAAGVATALSTDSHQPRDFILRTELRRFDRLVNGGSVSVAVAVDARLGQGRVERWLFERQYTRTLPAGSDSMNDTVTAFSQAVDQIIADLMSDMQQVSDLDAVGAVTP